MNSSAIEKPLVWKYGIVFIIFCWGGKNRKSDRARTVLDDERVWWCLVRQWRVSHSLSDSLRFRPLPLGAGFCVSLHTSVQNHLPLGLCCRPTQLVRYNYYQKKRSSKNAPKMEPAKIAFWIVAANHVAIWNLILIVLIKLKQATILPVYKSSTSPLPCHCSNLFASFPSRACGVSARHAHPWFVALCQVLNIETISLKFSS